MTLEQRLTKLEPFIQIVASEVCHDASIRDDVMQEARIIVYKISKDHPEVGHGYYVNSVKRSILNSVQRRSWTGSERPRGAPIDPLRRDTDSLQDPEISFDAAEDDPRLERVESEDRYAQVRDAVAGLEDARERELIYLMYWADQSYAEMSRSIGLSKPMVSVYLTRARDNLRPRLDSLVAA